MLKIYVSPEYYETVKECSSRNIPFIRLSDSQPVKQMDFVVFTDFQGNETMRNMLEINGNKVFYTDCLNTSHTGEFPLTAVLTNLYQSILHIRHGAYTDHKIFLNKFPIDMVRHELCIIRLCTDLLGEMIDIKQFTAQLETLTLEDENYCFVSTKAIMEQYLWEYKQNELSKKALNQIRQGIAEMEQCLENKKEWRNIWRIAYGIHNAPASIFYSVRSGLDAGS